MWKCVGKWKLIVFNVIIFDKKLKIYNFIYKLCFRSWKNMKKGERAKESKRLRVRNLREGAFWERVEFVAVAVAGLVVRETSSVFDG